jgi:hypothetical protein
VAPWNLRPRAQDASATASDEVRLDSACYGAVGAGALTGSLLWAAGALKEPETSF